MSFRMRHDWDVPGVRYGGTDPSSPFQQPSRINDAPFDPSHPPWRADPFYFPTSKRSDFSGSHLHPSCKNDRLGGSLRFDVAPKSLVSWKRTATDEAKIESASNGRVSAFDSVRRDANPVQDSWRPSADRELSRSTCECPAKSTETFEIHCKSEKIEARIDGFEGSRRRSNQTVAKQDSWRKDEDEFRYDEDSWRQDKDWEGSLRRSDGYGGEGNKSSRFSADHHVVSDNKLQQPPIVACASFKCPPTASNCSGYGIVARCYSDMSASKWGHSNSNYSRNAITSQASVASSLSSSAVSTVQTANYADNSISSSSSSSSSSSWGLRIDPEVKRKSRIVSYKAIAFEGKMKASVRRSFRWIKGKWIDVFSGRSDD